MRRKEIKDEYIEDKRVGKILEQMEHRKTEKEKNDRQQFLERIGQLNNKIQSNVKNNMTLAQQKRDVRFSLQKHKEIEDIE